MTDTTISDAVAFPQDDGTGVPDGSEDFDSAGYFGLLAQQTNVEHIGNGLDFKNIVTTDGSETVDVGAGHAFLKADQNTTSVQSGSQETYDTDLPTGSEMMYAVVLPTDTSSLSLGNDNVNDLWLFIDPTSNDAVKIRHGNGLSSPESDATPKPAIKLGTVDSTGGSTTRANDDRPVSAIGEYDIQAPARTDKLYVRDNDPTTDSAVYLEGDTGTTGEGSVISAARNMHFMTEGWLGDFTFNVAGRSRDGDHVEFAKFEGESSSLRLPAGRVVVGEPSDDGDSHDCVVEDESDSGWFVGNPNTGIHRVSSPNRLTVEGEAGVQLYENDNSHIALETANGAVTIPNGSLTLSGGSLDASNQTVNVNGGTITDGSGTDHTGQLADIDDTNTTFDYTETDTVGVGAVGVVAVKEVPDTGTLEVNEASLVNDDMSAVPSGVDLIIENVSTDSSESTLISGDGSIKIDEFGDPLGSYTNNTGSSEYIAVSVDNGNYNSGSGSNQDVYADCRLELV